MEISNSNLNDIDLILQLYHQATTYQKMVTHLHWQGFERQMVSNEILNNQQWKISIDARTACVFATTFDDPIIWKEKNKDPSVYLHRIAVNPEFRGKGFVSIILHWAMTYAYENNKRYIRLDTSAGNDKLLRYYQKCGFNYLGDTKVGSAEGLPKHYQNESFSLFEISL